MYIILDSICIVAELPRWIHCTISSLPQCDPSYAQHAWIALVQEAVGCGLWAK
jgi:hypothetical protein